MNFPSHINLQSMQTQEVPSEHQNIREHFIMLVTEHLNKFAESSSPGDFQKPSGHGPGHVGLSVPAWAGCSDKMTSRSHWKSLSTLTILWFCDFSQLTFVIQLIFKSTEILQ